MQAQDSNFDFKSFFSKLNPIPGVSDLANTLSDLLTVSNEINKSFSQGRQRIQELVNTVANVTPEVIRIGGTISDVQTTMSAIADTTKRNITGTEEEITKLVAANKILGTSASSLVDAFTKVGVSISQIPERLEDSIQYISSIGGNSQKIFGDVLQNMDKMNRFQFEGGVQGLTKMAAQASMLKFDMQTTFNLADKALDPEGAIELASAFQRMGVAAGNLVDPFQLMNQSINDPSGIQDSLINLTKQFTYFDEQTKQFKISPDGVLKLREIEKQAGMSSGALTKMATSAADLDRRMSKISASALSFENEEDKQLLANLLQMDKTGEYKIKMTDDEGKVQLRNLTEVTQTELNKLLQEQKDGPKDLESIARSQLRYDEIMTADVQAIKNRIAGGIVSTAAVPRELEGLRRIIDTFGGGVSRMGDTETVRKAFQETSGELVKLMKILSDSSKSEAEKAKAKVDFGTATGEKFKKYGEDFGKKFQETIEAATKNIKGRSEIEKLLRQQAGLPATAMTTTGAGTIGGRSYQSLVGGGMARGTSAGASAGTTAQGLSTTGQAGRDFTVQEITTNNLVNLNQDDQKQAEIDVNGLVLHKVQIESKESLTKEDLDKILTDTFTGPDFKKMVVGIYGEITKDPARSVKV